MILIHRDVARLISVVYFVQGAIGIAGIALPLYLRTSGFSVKEIAYYMSVVAIPWFFKIIYGAVSDAFPIFGLRRKPYLIACSFAASGGWFFMSLAPAQMTFLIAAMMIANFGFASVDVVTDGIVVEHSTVKTAQIYQSISWGARSIGALVSGVIGGYLAASVDYRLIFAMTALLPLVQMLVVCFYRERSCPSTIRPNIFTPIFQSLKHLVSGDLRWFCILLVIFSFSSSFFTPLFFYLKENLGFQEKLLGWLSSITWLGAIAGCFIYLNFFKEIQLKNALYIAILLGFLEILSCLFIQGRGTAFAIFFLGGILGYLGLLPMMSSSARLAHGTGIESSLFAILMGIFNAGQSISTFCGGWLYERIGLPLLIAFTAFLTLIGLLVIRKLKLL